MLESKAGVATAGIPPASSIAKLPQRAQLTLTCRAYRRKTINRHIRDKHTHNKQKPNSDKSPSNAARTRTRTQCNSVSQLLAATTHARICLKTNPSSSFQPESKHVPTACAVEQLELELELRLKLSLKLKLECACVGVYANAAQLIE